MLAAAGQGRSGFSVDAVQDRAVKSAELLRVLERHGWRLDRPRGSHHILAHPSRPGHISVPHPRKDLGKSLANRIRKQAGLA